MCVCVHDSVFVCVCVSGGGGGGGSMERIESEPERERPQENGVFAGALVVPASLPRLQTKPTCVSLSPPHPYTRSHTHAHAHIQYNVYVSTEAEGVLHRGEKRK